MRRIRHPEDGNHSSEEGHADTVPGVTPDGPGKAPLGILWAWEQISGQPGRCVTEQLATGSFGGHAAEHPPFVVDRLWPGAGEVLVGGGAPEAVVIDPGVDLGAVPSGGVGVSYGQTFALHSNPGSSIKVYLDFDGHTNTEDLWEDYFGNVGTPVVSPAFSADADGSTFSASELTTIQRTWQRMAEYFAPFNIDVTTEDPGVEGLRKTSAGDTAFGMRVIITEQPSSYGGVAYLNTFDGGSDMGCYVFSGSLGRDADNMADAAAHEVGHTLGLSHDGRTVGSTNESYYYGHGSGVTDWAPIMGVGYNANIVQWSKGEYYGANQTQDDLAIITSQNSGVAFRADEAGDSFATAAPLGGAGANGTTTVASWGVIAGSGARNDVDVYALNVSAGGSINLTVSAWTQVFVTGGSGPTYDQSSFTMMDLQVEVYDPSLARIATINDAGSLGAVVSLSGLAGGTYYLALDGVGFGDPFSATPTGYTEYGSIGQYMINGTYSSGPAPAGTLKFSESSLTTSEAGSSRTFDVFIDYAGSGTTPPESVVVQLGGLDATEGGPIPGSVVLNAGNLWRARGIALAGLDDRDAEGASTGYTLTASAAGYAAAGMAVQNLNDDVAPASAGSRGSSLGNWKKQPTASNATVAALSADDNSAMTISEGTIGRVQRLEWVWQFNGLTPDAGGKVKLQIDATATETFKFQSSTNGSTWADIAGSQDTSWNTAFDVSPAGDGRLWVKVVDLSTTSDSTRSSISIDLLTVEHSIPAPAPSGSEWLV